LVLALAGLAASCGDSVRRIADYQNLPGGNPLVPEVAALPYPSDFYLVEDASTPTGRRLQLPDEVMPRSVDATLFQQDGYTIIPAILAYLPGGTDVASLPSPTDHAATIADDSSVMLVREGTWERVGILAELDQTTTDTARQAIIIRPLQALEYETGYVVILRNSLRRLDGTPHEPSEVYAALRDTRARASTRSTASATTSSWCARPSAARASMKTRWCWPGRSTRAPRRRSPARW
jgi:hypothetical protein